MGLVWFSCLVQWNETMFEGWCQRSGRELHKDRVSVTLRLHQLYQYQLFRWTFRWSASYCPLSDTNRSAGTDGSRWSVMAVVVVWSSTTMPMWLSHHMDSKTCILSAKSILRFPSRLTPPTMAIFPYSLPIINLLNFTQQAEQNHSLKTELNQELHKSANETGTRKGKCFAPALDPAWGKHITT